MIRNGCRGCGNRWLGWVPGGRPPRAAQIHNGWCGGLPRGGAPGAAQIRNGCRGRAHQVSAEAPGG